MKKSLILRIALVSALVLLSCAAASGQKKSKKIDVGEALSGYFTVATDEAATPDSKGFITLYGLPTKVQAIVSAKGKK